MDSIELAPARRAAGTVRLPGSKSISNRALLLAALARGDTELSGLLDADDTRVMREALARLGVSCKGNVIAGVGGAFPVKKADLFLGNAGTAFRPLTAALALSPAAPAFACGEGMAERVAQCADTTPAGTTPTAAASAIVPGSVNRSSLNLSATYTVGLTLSYSSRWFSANTIAQITNMSSSFMRAMPTSSVCRCRRQSPRSGW